MGYTSDVKVSRMAKPDSRPLKRLPKRNAQSRQSSSSSSSTGGGSDEHGKMLAALQAHGRAMFGLAGPEDAESSVQAASRSLGSGPSEQDSEGEGEDYQSDDGWAAEDGFVSDSEDELVMLPPVGATKMVPEIFFAPAQSSAPDAVSKAERRAFLNGNSAKMMGLPAELDYGPISAKRAREEGEEVADDQSNLKLDKTLHTMLLTTLLPSAAANAASRPVDKRNAVSGRLLELASFSLPGQGAKSVSSSHLSRHPANIRTGLVHAKAKRDEKAHAEAQAASGSGRGYDGKKMRSEQGKRLRAGFGEEVGKKKGMEGRKEERGRGLAMGVGRFEGGMLRLSRSEIAIGSGREEGSFRGKRGKRTR